MADNQSREREALARIERAVDLHLGRSSWTQTKDLKGFGYSQQVRSELFAAHDEVRAVLASPPVAVQEEKCRTCNGHGLVGGFVSDGDGGGGYDSEPCPDCTPRFTANEVLAWLDAEGIEVTNVQFSRLAAMKGDQP